MKKSIYKIKYILVFVLGITVLQQITIANVIDVEKIESFVKEFSVNSDVELVIDNKYGKVHVETWGQNVVKLEVDIVVNEKTEKKAQERLEDIEINVEESTEERVVIRTLIDVEKWHNIYRNTTDFISYTDKNRINYTLHVPKTCQLTLLNEFGDIYIDDFSGDLKVFLKYGSLSGGAFVGGESYLNLSYGKADINEMKNGLIDAKYSKIEIEKSRELGVLCKYTSVEIAEIDILEVDEKYSKLKLGSVISLSGTLSYSELDVGELLNDVDLDVGFAPNFDIDFIPKQFESVEIDSKYTTLNIGFDESSNFELTAEIKLGDFRIAKVFTENVDFDERGKYKSLHAIVGDGKTGKVDLNVSYGKFSIDRASSE